MGRGARIELCGSSVLFRVLDQGLQIIGSWIDIACRAAGRNMTREEWEQFSWADEPYRRTCEEWPAATTT